MGYVCIHGHFYQPPRENPWLEAVELQDSAYPYHDWNERVTAECYAPNGASRILTGDDRVAKIVNNYGRISFNFGPTLLSWLKNWSPDTHRAIVDGDKESCRRFDGHGSAMAQAYSHMILPLANSRDKLTQIVWGIRDFQSRFGRAPEGLWLPETAVDLESLRIMAQQGIRFTILSPTQAARVRRMSTRQWTDVSGGRIDPTMAYRLRLGAIGRSISFTMAPSRTAWLSKAFSITERNSPNAWWGHFRIGGLAGVMPYCHRWRIVRSPSLSRRNGAYLRPGVSRE